MSSADNETKRRSKQMVTLARSKEQGQETQDLFDKSQGLSYVEYLIKFVNEAKSSSVSVDDIKDLEERFR